MAAARLALVIVASLLGACEPPGTEVPLPEPEPDEDPRAAVDEAQPEPVEPAETPEPEPEQRLAWVAVEDADRLALVDLDAGAVVSEHPAPGRPHNLVVADDGAVAAALYGATELLIVREGEATLVELGGTPHDVKATGELFVVANELAERVDLVTRDGEHRTSIPLTGQPHDTAVTPDGSLAWVTMNGTDELAVIDLERAEVVEYVPTGQSPHNILFAPDGETLWVTDWRGPVHAFTAGGELTDSFPVGEEAHHLAFTPDGGEVWVTDHHTEHVYIFDTEGMELADEVAVPGMPHHINITADGELAAVADHTSGTLVIYEVSTREQRAVVEVGAGPHGVWVVPS